MTSSSRANLFTLDVNIEAYDAGNTPRRRRYVYAHHTSRAPDASDDGGASCADVSLVSPTDVMTCVSSRLYYTLPYFDRDR